MNHTHEGAGFSGVGNKSSGFTMLTWKGLLDIQMAVKAVGYTIVKLKKIGPGWRYKICQPRDDI